jgi:large subunit ribosomal protein L10
MPAEQGDLMARPDKVAVVDEVRDRLTESTATVLTEYRGLTVTDLADLRAELRKSDAEYKVVKNTLTRIAVKDAGFDVPDELLVGPTAITFCAGDPVSVAKVLRAFSKDHPELVVKGSILDGKLLDAADTMKLADLESREELLSRLAGMFEAVLAQPARLALANLTKAARLLAALQAKRVEGGETLGDSGAGAPGGVDATAEAETSDAPAAGADDESSAAATVVDETPEPDSPAAEAVTEAAKADDTINATPDSTSTEEPSDAPADTAAEAPEDTDKTE